MSRTVVNILLSPLLRWCLHTWSAFIQSPVVQWRGLIYSLFLFWHSLRVKTPTIVVFCRGCRTYNITFLGLLLCVWCKQILVLLLSMSVFMEMVSFFLSLFSIPSCQFWEIYCIKSREPSADTGLFYTVSYVPLG